MNLSQTETRSLHIENITFFEYKEVISKNHDLVPDVTKAVHFHFISYRRVNRREICITMSNDEDGKYNK